LKVAFYSHHLSERGTEVALYDYARYNEEILGNQSIVIYNPKTPANNETAIAKFESRFQVERIENPNVFYDGRSLIPEIDKIIARENCDVLYCQNGGKNDGFESKVCKTVILVCSTNYEPHGDRYAYVSKWLTDKMTGGNSPWLPIIIDLHPTSDDLRTELEIPHEAFVLGRTGGMDTWNIQWVSHVISAALEMRKDLYFVFQNTPRFMNHPRIKHVKTTADVVFKSMFINTCDAMLHARMEGESFGQSIAEFSTKNKPILTYSHSHERAHIEILKEKGVYYENPQNLLDILTSMQKMPHIDWNQYKDHTPANGIKLFEEVFLK
jgi:hypothetical protein